MFYSKYEHTKHNFATAKRNVEHYFSNESLPTLPGQLLQIWSNPYRFPSISKSYIIHRYSKTTEFNQVFIGDVNIK